MTRGKIIFISQQKDVYVTLEFNGDMFPREGYGPDVIRYYENGGFLSVQDYKNFVSYFDEKHFRYKDNGADLINKCYKYNPQDGYDIRDNWTDYLYLVNESGESVSIITKQESISLENHKLAIIHFQNVDSIIERHSRKKKELEKEEFVEMIEKLKKSRDVVDKVNAIFRKNRKDLECDFCDGAAMQISHESLVIRLLEEIMQDDFEMISYFIYELDYGRNYEPGMIWADQEINMENAEALYEYLIKEKKVK